MTYREWAIANKPSIINPDCNGGCVGCPFEYFPLEGRAPWCIERNSYNADEYCTRCWDREIPGTENKKEKKNMATKTKKELMEELKEARENIENLKKEIEKCERYKQYEECADEFAALRESFVNAGFSKDEAFMMMRDILQAQIGRAFG